MVLLPSTQLHSLSSTPTPGTPPPRTSSTLPAISSQVAADPLPNSVSSPEPLQSEFSRNLEQPFAWTPPDLTMASQSGPSIVALSPSEVSQLGLGHFLVDSMPAQLADTQHGQSIAVPPITTDNSQASCLAALRERMHGTESRLYDPQYGKPATASGFIPHRHSMDQDASMHRVQRHNVPHMPLVCRNLLSDIPSSSVLFSSTSRERAVYARRPHEPSRGPCCHSDIRYDDAPSALDFHINTFPSSTAGPDVQLSRQGNYQADMLRSQRVPSFYQNSDSPSTSFLQSLGTSDSLSLSPTFSDQLDVNSRLIHLPSPTFSLSHFPSTLSSPIAASSEVTTEPSGDGITALPSNCGTRDIVINMTPISDADTNDILAPHSPAIAGPRFERDADLGRGVLYRAAKLGGKLKRIFLKRIRPRRNGENNGRHTRSKEIEDNFSAVHELDGFTPVTPPGLRDKTFSNLTQQLTSNVNSFVLDSSLPGAVVEADDYISQDSLRASDTANPLQVGAPQTAIDGPKPVKKRFSLSLFTRHEDKRRRQARPISMPDLPQCSPPESTCLQNGPDAVPLPCTSINGKETHKRSKRYSLQFLKLRS